MIKRRDKKTGAISFIPTAEDVEKLLEKLEEDDDVQNVYHTMEECAEY